MVITETISIIKGDTEPVSYKFKENGQVVDISSWQWKFTVKNTYNDVTALITLDSPSAIFDENNVEYGVLFLLTPTETGLEAGTYLFDVQVTVDGNVSTIHSGQIIVNNEVSA